MFWGSAGCSARGAPPPDPSGRGLFLHSTPYTLHPTPYTLNPAPYTLNPAPHTLHLTPYTLHPTPFTLHPIPCTLKPTPYTLNPTPLNVEVRREREYWMCVQAGSETPRNYFCRIRDATAHQL